MFAQIIPLTKLPLFKPQVYTYELGDLAKEIKIGQVVEVPLYYRFLPGIVVEFVQEAPTGIKYKLVTKILDPHPILNERDLELARFISEYYFSSLGLVLKQLTPGLLKKKSKKLKEELAKINLSAILFSPKLKTALKTEVSLIIGQPTERYRRYQEIIAETLKERRQILFLVPELILLEPTTDWLKQNFPNEKIVALYAEQSKTDQLINWRLAQSGGAKIFLGTRKAIFTSFYNLGHIIIDEEQSIGYKQWDMNPRYDARTVAEKKAALYDCGLTFGTNAPRIDTYFKFPVTRHPSPVTRPLIIDMRAELASGNYSIFSEQLETALTEALRQKKQAIIFVNRRGESTFVMCRDCGHIIRCPRCNLALMEHTNKTLSCGRCNFKTASPLSCPRCRSPRIKGFGIGVEKVEKELKQIFPQTKIVKLDTDLSSRRLGMRQRYREFKNGQIDILVGNQSILFLSSPKLALIAAINIDSILNFPHWQTDERAWQILRQITARNDAEQSVIQTYNPDNKILRQLKQENFAGFYSDMLRERTALKYPPTTQIIKLTAKSDDHERLQKESEAVAETLKKSLTGQDVIGPFRPVPEKIRNFWQREIIVKLELNYKNDKLKNVLNNLSNEWSIDVDAIT